MSNKQVAKSNNADLAKYNPLGLSKEEIKILEQTQIIPPDCPPGVVGHFAKRCATLGVDPFAKVMHIVPYNTKENERWVKKYAVITGIHVFEQRAHATGLYAGEDDVVFNKGSKGHMTMAEAIHHYEKEGKYPLTATATVYKIVNGARVPFPATVAFEEYAQVNRKTGALVGNWFAKPFFMIAKCARAGALRRAFPQQLEGLYTSDEIGAYGENVATVQAEHDEEKTRDAMIKEAKALISKMTKKSEFQEFWDTYPHFEEVREIVQAVQDRQNEIKEQFIASVQEKLSEIVDQESLAKLYDSNPAYERVPEVRELFADQLAKIQNGTTNEE